MREVRRSARAPIAAPAAKRRRWGRATVVRAMLVVAMGVGLFALDALAHTPAHGPAYSVGAPQLHHCVSDLTYGSSVGLEGLPADVHGSALGTDRGAGPVGAGGHGGALLSCMAALVVGLLVAFAVLRAPRRRWARNAFTSSTCAGPPPRAVELRCVLTVYELSVLRI